MLRGHWPFKALLARGYAVSLGHLPCGHCWPGHLYAPWSVPACDMCHMAALCTWHVALHAVR